MAQIGEHVRSRFMEQERLTYSPDGLTREQLRQDKVDQGNEAAYGGNGVADAALIAVMQKNGLDVEEYKAVFCKMYWCKSLDDFLKFPPKLKRTLDLRVSIEAGNAIHGGLGTEQQHEPALDVLRNIVDRYISLGWEGAEQGPELDRLLAEAEEMKEILRTYRQRNARR